MYLIHHQTVRGTRHIREGLPCEDASATAVNDSAAILVCADGHSDKRCTRAEKGASLAAETAVDKLGAFVRQADTRQLFTDTEAVVRHLIRSLVSAWYEAVQADLDAHPFTDDEIKPVSCGWEYRAGIDTQRAYGTTLIAGVITREYILLLHQGDGVCLLYHESGEAFSPVSKDPACVGNVATSLCSLNADSEMRYTLIKNKDSDIVAAALATDGIQSDSSQETAAYIASLFCEKRLEAPLTERSRTAGGDDVSLAYAVRDEEQRERLYAQSCRQLGRIRLENAVKRCSDKVYSIEHGGKLDALKPVDVPSLDAGDILSEAAALCDDGEPASVRQAKRLLTKILRCALRLYKDRLEEARAAGEKNAEYNAIMTRYEEAKKALAQAQKELEEYTG